METDFQTELIPVSRDRSAPGRACGAGRRAAYPDLSAACAGFPFVGGRSHRLPSGDPWHLFSAGQWCCLLWEQGGDADAAEDRWPPTAFPRTNNPVRSRGALRLRYHATHTSSSPLAFLPCKHRSYRAFPRRCCDAVSFFGNQYRRALRERDLSV